MVPDFQASAGFSADSDSPVQPNGVNPAESVGIVFDIKDDKMFNDVIAAIHLGFTDPADYVGDWYSDSLRIGVHAQGIGKGNYSHSYILTPVPGAVILGLLGLSVVGLKLSKYA